MQKNWLIWHFRKFDVTKFLWSDLRASPPQLFGRGAIAPMESAPMTPLPQFSLKLLTTSTTTSTTVTILLWINAFLEPEMQMGHLLWSMTHVTHHTVDPWPTWPMVITSFHRTHGTIGGGVATGMVVLVLDNPLGLESKKSQIKIKPPAVIIGVSSCLMSTKNETLQDHHGSMGH